MTARRIFHLIAFAILSLGTLGITSCGPTFRSVFLDSCQKDNNTSKQCLAALHYSNRIFFSKETPGHAGYTVLYNKLTVKEVREKLDTFIEDFKAVLDYNNPEMAQYIETFKLRPTLKHKQKVVQLIRSRVYAAELYLKFQQSMNQIESPEMLEHMSGYSSKKIFLHEDPAKTFPFTSDQIEGAKKRGVLKPIEHVLYDLSREYDRKVPDPAHPDDKNQFLWKSKKMALDVTNYKIINDEKPENNLGNYIEGYRVIDGKKESHPSLKVFFPSDGVAVVVIDSNREGIDPDGGPDFVEQMAGLISVQDVTRSDLILSTLFDEKREEQQPPQLKKVFVEVAPIGTPVDVWEYSKDPNGYLVPYKYTNAMPTNYVVGLKFKKPDMKPGGPMPEFKTIDYVGKTWSVPGGGMVYEYFRAKDKYQKPIDAEVGDDVDQKHIHFELQDGSDVNMLIPPGSNVVIEDKPYAIAYKDGQSWYWIEKDPGKSVFNKRKKWSDPASAGMDDEEKGGDAMHDPYSFNGTKKAKPRALPSFSTESEKP